MTEQGARDHGQEQSGFPREHVAHARPPAPATHISDEHLRALAQRWDQMGGDHTWRHTLVMLHDLGLIGGITDADIHEVVTRRHFTEDGEGTV